VHIDEAVDAAGVEQEPHVARLGLGEGRRAREDVAARAARGLALGDAPQEVAVAVEVHAVTARVRVVAAVLAPEVVDRHHVVSAVGVRARHDVDVERLHEDLDVTGGPHAPVEHDVGAVAVADDQLDGELDQRIGVHQLPRVHATDQQHPASVVPDPGPDPQCEHGPAQHRELGELEALAVLREELREQPAELSS
jgi:hypothetical protein